MQLCCHLVYSLPPNKRCGSFPIPRSLCCSSWRHSSSSSWWASSCFCISCCHFLNCTNTHNTEVPFNVFTIERCTLRSVQLLPSIKFCSNANTFFDDWQLWGYLQGSSLHFVMLSPKKTKWWPILGERRFSEVGKLLLHSGELCATKTDQWSISSQHQRVHHWQWQ